MLSSCFLSFISLSTAVLTLWCLLTQLFHSIFEFLTEPVRFPWLVEIFHSKCSQQLTFSTGFKNIFSVYMYLVLKPSLHQVQCHMSPRVRILCFSPPSYIMIPCCKCVESYSTTNATGSLICTATDHDATSSLGQGPRDTLLVSSPPTAQFLDFCKQC